ncbi:MAG: hypothetical protein H7Y59_05285 [Anaerolineales bacterium]|nr:hypothetical protein [Anaerolineales bacterium]
MTSKSTKPKTSAAPKAKNKKKESIDASQVTIIVAVLGLLGVIVGGVFTYWSVQTQVYAPIQATQTSQAFNLTQTAFILNANPPSITTNTPEIPTVLSPTETVITPPQPSINFLVPTVSDLNLVPTIYIGYLDIKTPETRSYTVKVSRRLTYLWTYLWCAKFSGTLDENISKMKFSFFVDDISIPESNFLVFKDPSAENWYCQKWTTMLSGWGSQPPTLSVIYEIPTPISDGVTTFPIGIYGHEIIVTYID